MNNNVLGHQPVLLAEVISGLRIKLHGIYIDATFGRGGHCAELLRYLDERGQILAIDRDPAAVQAAQEKFLHDPRVMIEQSNFSNLEKLVIARNWQGKIDGILFDLGVASPQFDNPERGFSFNHNGPLDMRMNPQTGETAAQWLARASATEIEHVLREFGEERYAAVIARSLVKLRQTTPLNTTTALTKAIVSVYPRWERDKHPATRTFQAMRIFINQELTELTTVLPQAAAALAPHGRLIVISFHSLEDRIVKRFIRRETRGELLPRDLPIINHNWRPRLSELFKGIIRPTEAEVRNNPRARSAILRIAERLEY